MPIQLPRRASAAHSAALVIAALALAACATPSGQSGPTHPVEVRVENNLTLPTDLTVYAKAEYGAARILLGDVPPGKTRTLTFTPASFSETYRLTATRSLGRQLRSQPFTVGSSMTGVVIWTLVPNIIGFEDVADSTGTDTTHATSPPAQ